ncbi:Ribosomal RNA small subunit methyltransferase A [Gossypium arboreum]|uniref:Ribosomal RNA small subunit methyltransferase A n=1 Tax=Gossypium arboreum TaxID=29729 RepID=A0A0B0NTG7_GOSAR|nr:Ribosomal RNA small subunit methyltransferase A [Gossypium arboreum]
MAVAFTHLSWWLWSGKHQEPRIANGSSLSSSPDSGLLDSDNLKFPLVKRANMASSSRKVRRKWHSREERKIDREYDVVIVPSDGGCVSGSESDGSDYSIGWMEPHGPGFNSDDESDNSFAVLVPCYGHRQDDMLEDPKNNLLGAIVNIPNYYSSGPTLAEMVAAVHLLFIMCYVLQCDAQAKITWNSGFHLCRLANISDYRRFLMDLYSITPSAGTTWSRVSSSI